MVPVPKPEPTPVDRVIERVGEFRGIVVAPHRFGGREFRLGSREVGHVHGNGFVDINFPRPLRDALVDAELTDSHHLYPDSGWTTYRVTIPAHVQGAVDLLRVSYLYHAAALSKRNSSIPEPDLEAELEALGIPESVTEAFAPVA